ncbi:hypothetical protein GE09DRAFT_1241730 [Coniochaeta sp. 2T2.1]|nr:hypothetical protein GE09DRAFT_1241730 [Coniochaeta sp. 2T2.1]
MAYQQPSSPKDATSTATNCVTTEGRHSQATPDNVVPNPVDHLDAFERIFKAEIARNAAQMPPAAHFGAHGACPLTIPHWHDESGKTRASSLDVLRLLKHDFPLITERERIRRMLEFARIGDLRCILEDIHGREVPSKKPQGIQGEVEKSQKAEVTASVETQAIVAGEAEKSQENAVTAGKATTEDDDEEDLKGMVISGEASDEEDDSSWSVVSEDVEEDWDLMY